MATTPCFHWPHHSAADSPPPPMATTPCFHWPHHSAAGGAPDSDVVAGFRLLGSPELALMAPATTTQAAAAHTTALLVPPDRAMAGRPRLRRSSSVSGKQHKPGGGGGGAKKPPQRGLGVAELERLRCGGDPLLELAGAAQVHPLMLCNHTHHHHAPAAPAFDARYYSSLLVQPPHASPPAAPGCYVHHPAMPGCHQRAPSLGPPEQHYFVDRWGRMGPAGSGAGVGCGDHQAQSSSLLLAPEHPSSQSTIWPPAASSSCCLQAGHRCDLCNRRMVRSLAETGAASLPLESPTTVPDYSSVYNLAAAMATAPQGGSSAFHQLVRDRKRGAFIDEAPAKKEVREMELFPAASAHHHPDESEFVPPVSLPHYGGAGSCAAPPPPPLDLSLRL